LAAKLRILNQNKSVFSENHTQLALTETTNRPNHHLQSIINQQINLRLAKYGIELQIWPENDIKEE